MARAITAVLALGLSALAGAASAQTRTAGFNVTATVVHDCQVRVSEAAALTLDCTPGAVAFVRVSCGLETAVAVAPMSGKSPARAGPGPSTGAPAAPRPTLISIEF